jgi:hypothetical protein
VTRKTAIWPAKEANLCVCHCSCLALQFVLITNSGAKYVYSYSKLRSSRETKYYRVVFYCRQHEQIHLLALLKDQTTGKHVSTKIRSSSGIYNIFFVMKWPEDDRILVETCRPVVPINICVDGVKNVTLLYYIQTAECLSSNYTRRNP